MISENNYEEAQTYLDPENPSELEQNHVPIIEADTNYVKVVVGEAKHVMEANHWIQYIELFVDGESIARTDLMPSEEPEAEFEMDVPKAKNIVAQILCNTHGLWENELVFKNK